MTSLFGNVLLLGCFVDKQEGGATAVQAIGAVANYMLLAQVHMTICMCHISLAVCRTHVLAGRSGYSMLDLCRVAADMACRNDAFCGFCTFDCAHGLSSNSECMQVLRSTEQQAWTDIVAKLARLSGLAWDSHAPSGNMCVHCSIHFLDTSSQESSHKVLNSLL